MLWLLIGLNLVSLGVYLDILSMRLYLSRHKHGHGPSGVPLVGLLFYWIVILHWGAEWPTKLTTLALFTVFHIAAQYIIPMRRAK
jgi:hypothetical protein